MTYLTLINLWFWYTAVLPSTSLSVPHRAASWTDQHWLCTHHNTLSKTWETHYCRYVPWSICICLVNMYICLVNMCISLVNMCIYLVTCQCLYMQVNMAIVLHVCLANVICLSCRSFQIHLYVFHIHALSIRVYIFRVKT